MEYIKWLYTHIAEIVAFIFTGDKGTAHHPIEPTPELPPTPEPATERLAEEAKLWLGKDASPQNRAPQELSCAEGVVNIVNSAFPGRLPKYIISTAVLYAELKKSPYFTAVLTPMPGCIEVAPTEGDRHGHCGIYTQDNVLASNDSRTGLFEENYTRESFRNNVIIARNLKGYLFIPL